MFENYIFERGLVFECHKLLSNFAFNLRHYAWGLYESGFLKDEEGVAAMYAEVKAEVEDGMARMKPSRLVNMTISRGVSLVISRFRYIASRAERRRFACNSVWAFNLAPAFPRRALTLCPQLCMGISHRAINRKRPI
jgi:hypothetical protein